LPSVISDKGKLIKTIFKAVNAAKSWVLLVILLVYLRIVTSD
jgi:hypothetical protein